MKSVNIRQLATNYGLLAAGEAASKLFAFAAFTYLARRLGPATFGSVEFALALTLIFTLFVEGGFSPYGAREVAKDPGRASWLACRIVAIRAVLAFVGFTLLLGLVALLDTPWPTKQLVVLYGLTLFATPVLLPWVFQGLDRMGVVATATTIRWIAFAGGVLLWVREPGEAWRVPVVEIGALALAAAFNLSMYRRAFGAIRPSLEPRTSLTLLLDALPIGLSQILWAMRFYFATIMLGLVVGGKPLGWFAAAHRIVLALNIFGALYLFNLLPSLSRAPTESREALQGIMRASIPLVAWTTVFVGAVGTAFAEPLMAAVFGAGYSEGASSLRLLIWVVPTALLTGHFRYTLVAHDAQWLDLRCAALGSGTCVALTLLLVPTQGPVGAAGAILGSELVTWGAAYFFVRRRIAIIPVGRHLAGPVFAGAVMVALVGMFPSPSPWLLGTVGVLAYMSALAMLGPKMLADIRSLLAQRSS